MNLESSFGQFLVAMRQRERIDSGQRLSLAVILFRGGRDGRRQMPDVANANQEHGIVVVDHLTGRFQLAGRRGFQHCTQLHRLLGRLGDAERNSVADSRLQWDKLGLPHNA